MNRESDDRYWQAVGRLAEPQRELLRLRFVVGLSHSEIGNRFGMSEEAARKLIPRVLLDLEPEFAEA